MILKENTKSLHSLQSLQFMHSLHSLHSRDHGRMKFISFLFIKKLYLCMLSKLGIYLRQQVHTYIASSCQIFFFLRLPACMCIIMYHPAHFAQVYASYSNLGKLFLEDQLQYRILKKKLTLNFAGAHKMSLFLFL